MPKTLYHAVAQSEDGPPESLLSLEVETGDTPRGRWANEARKALTWALRAEARRSGDWTAFIRWQGSGRKVRRCVDGGRGRPPAARQPRGRTLRVRLTEGEMAALSEAASHNDVAMSDIVRDALRSAGWLPPDP